MARAVIQQATRQLHAIGTGEQQLEHVVGRVGTAGGGQAGRHATAQDGDPAQRQPKLIGSGQHQVWRDIEFFETDVGLHETVEQHQPLGAGLGQPCGHVGHRAEVRRHLHGHRQRDLPGDRFDQVDITLFDLRGRVVHAGCQEEDVQLDRISAGFLHLVCNVRPAARRVAVETGDDRDLQRLLGLRDQVQVLVAAGTQASRFLEEATRFGRHLGTRQQQPVGGHLVVLDLLFEERRQDDGRYPGGLQPFQALDVAGQRRGRSDDGVGQFKPEIPGAKIDTHFAASCWGAAAPDLSPAAAG